AGSCVLRTPQLPVTELLIGESGQSGQTRHARARNPPRTPRSGVRYLRPPLRYWQSGSCVPLLVLSLGLVSAIFTFVTRPDESVRVSVNPTVAFTGSAQAPYDRCCAACPFTLTDWIGSTTFSM